MEAERAGRRLPFLVRGDVDGFFGLALDNLVQPLEPVLHQRHELGFQFGNGVRLERFDEELMRKLAQAGAHHMAIAVESANAASSSVTVARGGHFPSIGASASYGLSAPEMSNLKDNRSQVRGGEAERSGATVQELARAAKIDHTAGDVVFGGMAVDVFCLRHQ